MKNVIMYCTETELEVALLNLCTYKADKKKIYVKNIDQKKQKYGIDIIPLQNISDIKNDFSANEIIQIVHKDSMMINEKEEAEMYGEEFLNGEVVYINSDSNHKKVLRKNETFDNCNVLFMEFHSSLLFSDYFTEYISKFEDYDDLFIEKNNLINYILFLLKEEQCRSFKKSILFSKNYQNQKKIDHSIDIYNYVFLGEYKPWINLEKSAYGMTHDSTLNILYFKFWYEKLFNSDFDLEIKEKYMAIQKNNEKIAYKYIENMIYKKNITENNLRKVDNFVEKITSEKSFVKNGNKKMKKSNFNNKLIKSKFTDKYLWLYVSLKGEYNSEISMEYGDYEFQPFKKLAFHKKNNKEYLIAIFRLDIETMKSNSSINTQFVININGEKKYLFAKKFKRLDNINNIRTILYEEEEIYYLRNGFDGRVIMQKKPRLYFETPKNLKYSKKAFKKRNVKSPKYIVLYEKNGEHMEESAYQLFKRIYTNENVFFVLHKSSPKYEAAKKEYGTKIIDPSEKRFYDIVLNAKYFIGTESPVHVIGIRSYNKYVRTKIMDKSAKFIFLQHGITYSLSLEGNARSLFKKNSSLNLQRIVVSSEKEADHWKTYGGFSDNNLYKTGLVTFDNKKINDDANKITIFLTWRPWEEQIEAIEDTTYGQDIINIITEIQKNKKLEENTQIILHPKFKDKKVPKILEKYVTFESIDKLMNTTDTLITDYSSICYDSFYRGSKVIFWWNRNEENMEKYRNKIMLTENNVFGDIITNNEMIVSILEKNYKNDQTSDNILKYRKINEFSDDKNMERLLYCLKKDNII